MKKWSVAITQKWRWSQPKPQSAGVGYGLFQCKAPGGSVHSLETFSHGTSVYLPELPLVCQQPSTGLSREEALRNVTVILI